MIPKYKAYIKSKKSIVDIESLNLSSGFVKPVGDTTESYSFDEINLMQSTGLKDSHDIEIYEGDIVEDGEGLRKCVQWYKGGFVYTSKHLVGDGKKFRFSNLNNMYNKSSNYTVIGNVYNNPELLERG